MIYPDDFINKVICGDCLEVMKEIPDNSIDLVFTDPPYLKEFLYTYDILAEQSPRIMKHGASLMMITPHYSLPSIVKSFDGKLKYRWAICLNQFNGSHARMAMGIEVMWKLVLWYVKGSYPSGRGFLRDGIEITGKDGQKKSRHKWEQDASWAEYYIQRLTKEGDTVLDPFVGSGTVADVCQKLGRNFIGVDISEEYCNIARQRLGL
jgi:DNA modification methylase